MLEQIVEKTIKKYNLIKDNDSIVIGVSGGPDSIALLDILRKKENIKIYVAHINHMAREDAGQDEEYVIQYCKKNNIPVFTKKIDIIKKSKQEKIGTEQAGRQARYEFFEEIMQKTNSNKIATAHNKNDLVETLIMNQIRGSGVSGLKSIEPIRDGKFIRPLIEAKREEIEKYCEDKKLNPRYDYTNKENVYTRNKIRNVIIPYIQENINPNIIESLTRLSQIATEESDYIQKQTQKSYNEILEKREQENIQLNLIEFNKLDMVIKKRVVMYTINELVGNTREIEKINIEDIIKLCTRAIGNKYLLPNKNIKILIKNKKIYFIKIT